MSSNITIKRNSVVQQAASIRSTQTMTSIALLSAISFVLSFLEFPVPLSPSFAKMDLSDFPALIGAMSLGPWAGVSVELIKNLLGLLSTSTGGVGELANFLMGGSMTFVAGTIYYKGKGTAIPFINTKLDVVFWNTIPFNLSKGLGISIATLLIIPKLTPVLRGRIH